MADPGDPSDESIPSMEMTPVQLGESMAQLVWESFTDFVELHRLPAEDDGDGGVATAPAISPEEALILFMWVHTQTCRQALAGRVPQERVKEVLDDMHRAVFEDLEAQFVPAAQLPLFEQRVSARYSEYYDAALHSTDEMVVEVAARHIAADGRSTGVLSLELAEATAAAVRPFRDYLDDISLSG